MRLINREALLAFESMDAKLCASCGEHHTAEDVIMMIKTAPAIDAVPVVRCRECKHWKKGEFQAGDDVMHLEYGGYCPNSRFARYESDFCSRGEKRRGENGTT